MKYYDLYCGSFSDWKSFFHGELNCHLSLKTLNRLVVVNSLKWKVELLSLANSSCRLIFNGPILMTIKLRIHRTIEIRKKLTTVGPNYSSYT